MASHSVLLKRARKIRLVAMDIDGVLTSGEIIVLGSGEEIKMWNAKDRLLLAILKNHRDLLTIAWITGRSSKNVDWSAKDLGIPHVAQGVRNKKSELDNLLAHYN